MRRSASIIIAGSIIAGTGMAALWSQATLPPNVGMADRDVTWSDPTPAATPNPVPTRTPAPDVTPETTRTVPAPNVGTPTTVPNVLTPRQAWAACVVHALTTPGMGGDADMTDCDDAYWWDTGLPADLWLMCPGEPEQGGCWAEDHDNPRIPPPATDAPEEPEVWEENPTPTAGPNVGSPTPQVTTPEVTTPEASPEATTPEPLEGDLNA